MSDYETLFFLERQEAFWKSRKLLVYHEASDGPFGPFGTLGPFGPFGPFGALGPFGPFGPFGTLGPFGPYAGNLHKQRPYNFSGNYCSNLLTCP